MFPSLQIVKNNVRDGYEKAIKRKKLEIKYVQKKKRRNQVFKIVTYASCNQQLKDAQQVEAAGCLRRLQLIS